MGKTLKKAAPGGDERNLYVRRFGGTTSASSRASEQRESESLNRSKLTGAQKKVPITPGKPFKSKLRTPTKSGLAVQASKQIKKSMKHPEAKTANMQSEGEVKSVSIQKENVKEENGNKAAVLDDKKHIDQVSSEHQSSPNVVQEIIFTENRATQEKEGALLESSNTEAKELQQEEQDEDIKLTLETENSTENGEKVATDKQPQDDQKMTEIATQEELKNGINDKEEIQNEVPTDTESYSVDIVESTTSEVSETSESVSQSDLQKDKEKNETINNDDASFITYNSSIMLKDVQIRLNDCLKDNSKLFEVSNMEDTPSLQSKNLSFGKTLRNISGRHSINRMRHVTLRERRISPNSSLFVNTSAMSIAQDEGNPESKVLHYSSDMLSKTFPTNGSPLDRKRKIEIASWGSSKKPKTADESLLNTSFGFLRGFNRMQVSTPKATNPYKFESTRLNISGMKDDDNTIKIEPTESTKKWCVIM